MAEDWLADVRKYHPGADEGVVKKISNYLGIALRNRDSSLVAFSNTAEVGRVRERFLRKKLGLTAADADLDAGLDAVKRLMTADRTKNRVTVYYLLADYFGKHDLFGGAASAPGSFSFGAAGAAAAKPVKVAKPTAAKRAVAKPAAAKPAAAKAAKVKAASVKPAAVKSAAVKAAPVAAASGGEKRGVFDGAGAPAYVGSTGSESRVGVGGIGKWLLLAAAIVLTFMALRMAG
ncbi:DUF2853 family protein [Sphingomonas sp.]|uniref:DUF2853 family protein n=1 Tax=Sphingomonas sp. TaxID=28214 RepID=UPI00286B7CAD|nr:DUF2853 family protein [Sphingomonas sp.]